MSGAKALARPCSSVPTSRILWKHRNACTFNNTQDPLALLRNTINERRDWVRAVAAGLAGCQPECWDVH